MKILSILVALFILFSCNDPTTTIIALTAVVGIEAPSEATPLSTVLTIGSVNRGSIEILVKGKTPEMDIAHIYPAGYGTKFPIHGMYADYDNTIVIKGVDDGINITTNLLTKPTLANNATVTIDKLDAPDKYNQNLFFYNATNNYIAAYDRNGDTRYYQTIKEDAIGRGQYHLQSVFFDKNRNEILTKDDRGIYDLLGNAVIDFPKDATTTKPDVHHDSVKKGDNYIVLSYSQWGVEDTIKEMTPSGTIVNNKTFGSLFRDIVTEADDLVILNQIIYDDDNIYEKDGTQTVVDWAHVNSLVYDNTSDILYASLRNQAVIAIDYSEWKLLWWMADNTLDTIHAGVPNRNMNFIEVPSLAPYRVKGDGQTDGPKNQHALLLKTNGNIVMFDNQGDKKTNSEGSRYVEYAITGDPGAWTASIAREYRNEKLFSPVISDVDLTGDDHQNILLTYGVLHKIIEINANDEILFDMTLQLAGTGWGPYTYRGAKMPLYPYNDSTKKYSIEYNEKEGI